MLLEPSATAGVSTFAGARRDVADRGIADRTSVIRAYDGGPYQTCRGELQEMAKAAADRRNEGLWPADPGAGHVRSPSAEAPPPNEALVRAERIRANAARLRELHIDLAACEQIDAVVATILSAAALRNPADPRVRQLADVLGHLERRIHAMLDDATRVAPAPRDVLPVKSETSKDDPLAALMALSDEERIALFS